MTQPIPHSLKPVLIRLDAAIAAHVDAEDRDDFRDTVLTTATRHDATKGRDAGDHYIAEVIRSLMGASGGTSGDGAGGDDVT